MKKILVIIFFIIQLNIYAEYIFFQKKNGNTTPIIDLKIYTDIYNLISTYQWPSIIGFAQKLPTDEVKEVVQEGIPAEENFLRKKLKKISPDLDLIFIPTTIYELFLYGEKRAGNLSFSLAEIEMPKSDDALMKTPGTTKEKVFLDYASFNKSKGLIEIHQNINNSFITYILSFNPKNTDFTDILTKEENKIVAKIIETFNKYEIYRITQALVKKFTDIETIAHKNNYALLYRGGRVQKIYTVAGQTEPFESTFIRTLFALKKTEPTFEEIKKAFQEKKSIATMPWSFEKSVNIATDTNADIVIPLPSISFGNSLIAGLFFDSSASAYVYLVTANIFYALKIKKYDYIFGDLNKLFFISPYNTLISLSIAGEGWHSRSVSCVSKSFAGQVQKIRGGKIWNVLGIQIRNMQDEIGLFVNVCNPIKQAYELSDYLEKNAIIIKTPKDDTGDYFPSKNAVDNLIRAQHELTGILKSMFVIQQTLQKKIS